MAPHCRLLHSSVQVSATSFCRAPPPLRTCVCSVYRNPAQLRAMSTKPIAQVKSLDHIVLTVADISTTTEFYTKFLGMRHESFSTAAEQSVKRHALVFGDQKINLHKSGAEFEPKAYSVMPGSGDLCFITDTKVDDVLAGLQAAGLEVLEGGKVVERTGARGKLRSVYFRDPDGNLVEVSNYV